MWSVGRQWKVNGMVKKMEKNNGYGMVKKIISDGEEMKG